MAKKNDTLKHYVEFLYPGLLVSESDVKLVKSRNPRQLKSVPKQAFGFRFFSRTEQEVDGEVLSGKSKNYSGMFYPGGTTKTLVQVKQQHADQKILISNMENNGYDRVVFTRRGNVQPLNNGDVVYDKPSNLKDLEV